VNIYNTKYESHKIQSGTSTPANGGLQKKLVAKEILPNINSTQAAERAEKWRFFVPGDLDL